MRLLGAIILSACISTDAEVGDLLFSLGDRDGDGYASIDDGGEDCDDEDVRVFPGAHDFWYDGVDSDCEGNNDFDADYDTWESAEYGGQDCDDTRANVNPGEIEYCDGGIDNDCDPETEESGCD